MKELPIIFSGPMVRAIPEGRKCKTRRVIKPQPKWIESSGRWKWPLPKKLATAACPSVCSASREWWEYLPAEAFPWRPSDRLWVREKWRPFSWTEDGGPWVFQYAADMGTAEEGEVPPESELKYEDWNENIWQQASDECIAAGIATDSDGYFQLGSDGPPPKWRSPIFMPRWASRITLEVTDVRVERLQDISEEDAEAEGVERDGIGSQVWWNYKDRLWDARLDACGSFSTLWDSIHRPPHDWNSNSWVWVISFRPVEIRGAGTVEATLKYAGEDQPIPEDDPWAK